MAELITTAEQKLMRKRDLIFRFGAAAILLGQADPEKLLKDCGDLSPALLSVGGKKFDKFVDDETYLDNSVSEFWREFLATGSIVDAQNKAPGMENIFLKYKDLTLASEAKELAKSVIEKQYLIDVAVQSKKIIQKVADGKLDSVAKEIAKLQALPQPDKPRKEPRVYSAKEIFQTDWPDPVWAVNTIQPVGLTIFGGKAKLGKSFMALQKSYAIGTGEKFLGYDVEPGRVLFIALEDHPRSIKARQQKQLWDQELDWNIDFVFRDQFWQDFGDLRNGGNEQVARMIEKNNYRLVIIDTLSKAIKGTQRSIEEMVEWLDPITNTAHNQNACVEFVDHHGKQSNIHTMDAVTDILESTAKGAIADTIWGLYRERGSLQAKLSATGREIPDMTIDLVFDQDTCLWQFVKSDDRPKLPGIQSEILAFILEVGSTTNQAIAASVGLDVGNCHKEVQELVAKGLVKRQKNGRSVFYTSTDKASIYEHT